MNNQAFRSSIEPMGSFLGSLDAEDNTNITFPLGFKQQVAAVKVQSVLRKYLVQK